ncbi:MAG TPA: ImmA/IrrE family metallo-endopeptidase [Nocardioidaceae bacterium]|nr:ImmA/IrrE family metallo-endopeptidase [Nocardioidaceae bacterium]
MLDDGLFAADLFTLPLVEERFTREDARRSIDELVGEALRYRSSEKFQELLEFIGRFRRLKPFNAMLVHAQREGAVYVAPAHRWLADFDRRVKPGEHPLVMLQPFGPVMFVYDVSQTEPLGDDEFMDGIANPFAMPPMHGIDVALALTLANAKRDGVRIVFAPAGSQHAGCIQTVEFGQTQKVVGNRRTGEHQQVPVRYEVVINVALSPSERYATLVHELGHLYCGHVGSPDPTWWPDRRALGKSVREFEAEAVAYLACRRVDDSARMPTYLAGYLDEHEATPKGISLERIAKAAGDVVELGESLLKPRGLVPRVAPTDPHAGTRLDPEEILRELDEDRR